MSVGQARLFTAFNAVEEFTVFATPSSHSLELPVFGGAVTSDPSTANVVGGTPPYTFLWVKTSGDGITIGTPNDQSTTFTAIQKLGSPQEAEFKVTVTDSLAAEASDTVTVKAETFE